MKALARKATVAKQTQDQSIAPKKAWAWIRAGAIAIHKRTGNRYIIDAIGLDKTHDQKVVVYRASVGDATVYVREYTEFAAKFSADRQLSISLE